MKAVLKNWMVAVALAVSCLLFLALTYFAYTHAAQTAAAQTAPRTQILLDAGHGGEDGGTKGYSELPEKDINLDIALRLQRLLEEQGCEVLMTRTKDVSLAEEGLSTVHERKVSDLQKRLELLQAHPGCLFVSIHQNHFSESIYSGAQVFYSPNHPQSQRLAEAVHNAIVSSLQPDNHRQNKPADQSIYLLWHAQTPAILVECGFLSNVSEAAQLNEAAYRQKMAQSIAQGILQYIQQAENTQSQASPSSWPTVSSSLRFSMDTDIIKRAYV